MQTIRTKYLGPTNYKPAKIMARTTSGITRFFSYDPAFSADGNHKLAAYTLATELKWSGKWRNGQLDASTEIWVNDIVGQSFQVKS